jgi:hypothetical protein
MTVVAAAEWEQYNVVLIQVTGPIIKTTSSKKTKNTLNTPNTPNTPQVNINNIILCNIVASIGRIRPVLLRQCLSSEYFIRLNYHVTSTSAA